MPHITGIFKFDELQGPIRALKLIQDIYDVR
jgi:hypothetical protein